MRLGVFTVLFQDLPFEEALDRIAGMGLQAVEIGTGNYPGDKHCQPDELLGSPGKLKAFKSAVEKRNLIISALSCHGNPLSPDPDWAETSHTTWRKTVELASALEVPVIDCFSGCPGDGPTATRPNWVTCAWPPEYLETLRWQWEERVIPYWQGEAAFAREHGISKIALEMHPGFVVYNPETLLRLRAAVGEEIGANFDPSHLFWQGIDAVAAIKALGAEQAIFHVHAKDVFLDEQNVAVNGVLDTKPYGDLLHRSWSFRSVGYGHGETVWRDIVSALRMVDYDYVISIEHEDALASAGEGLAKAVDVLNRVIFKEDRTAMWWA